MKKLTSYFDFNQLYLLFLLLLVVSLPFARFGMSVAQFGLLGLWFLEGEFKRKIQDLMHSKAALVLISFYVLHMVGIIYSNDLEYALKDLRIKLPLLFLPVVFATSPRLRKQNMDLILKVYIVSVLVATLISLYISLTRDIKDFRELSPFISHIRLSLNVCLAFFFTMYFAHKKYQGKIVYQLGLVGISIWLVAFLVMIESATGIIILIVTGFFLLLYAFILERHITQKIAALVFIIAIPVMVTYYLNQTIKQYFVPQNDSLEMIDRETAQGNPYWHDTINQPVENGSRIGLYICEQELRKEWNLRSELDYDGPDKKGQDLKYTLFRYMNSKGLRKDAQGMQQMNSNDIRNVEKGIANVAYTRKFSLKSRLYKIFWEYQVMQQGLNPGGHSVIQRLEYWKASLGIISDHLIFGVGTGDVRNAFTNEYQSNQTVLAPQYQHRAHNQFLAVFVAFGLIGFICFVTSLIYPPLILRKFFTYHYFVFWITMVISMLVEDSLETQVGVTLFAFFNTFLLFAEEKDKNQPNKGLFRIFASS
ncbi:MAG: O-antigen ligase family protein [Bacteroidetes bacterium]|nr:O-antigen ligase family protein [Bacteroidota bacterium]